MAKFSYVAMDQKGKETRGTIEVASQSEALARIKEMGLFPTKVVQLDKDKSAVKSKTTAKTATAGKKKSALQMEININIKIPGLGGKVKTKTLTTFTRQLATLVDAGLPLLRGLRVLEKQERNRTLKKIIGEMATAIESGSTFSEALAQHPKVFNKLFVNMVKAGEIGGVLEVVLRRLAEFMEKAEKIKGKVKSAMFYPSAVITVAITIMGVLMTFVIPKFEEVFKGLMEGKPLPAFTQFVLNTSRMVKDHAPLTLAFLVGLVVLFSLLKRTKTGRYAIDYLKLKMPILGPLFSRIAIARFTRTLGTLISSGVPILQALTIVRETAGNMVVAKAINKVHEAVKEGETITAPLEASRIFPPMVISMVDVGEQTGALPEMLLRVADNYDEEVDNAVAALTSLLEPIMIVFLAVIVGSIVIAMFLPLVSVISGLGGGGDRGSDI